MSNDNGRLPWMKFWPTDFLAETRALSEGAIALYVLLLCTEWMNGPLPVDHSRLARLAGMAPRDFEKHWPDVSRFFTERDGFIVHNRLESERASAQREHEARSRGGKITALKRFGKQ